MRNLPMNLDAANPLPCDRSARSNRRLRAVYFFLDLSNITISAQRAAKELGEREFRDLRIHFHNLQKLALRGRTWISGYIAAGLHNPHSPLVERVRQMGFRFEACELGHLSGCEQGVDEKIQCAMFRLAFSKQPRATVVLATGDGNGHERMEGFLPAMEAVRAAGFSIEIMSWAHSFNQRLWTWAGQYGTAVVLNDYYYALTYLKGRRSALPLELSTRETRLENCAPSATQGSQAMSPECIDHCFLDL